MKRVSFQLDEGTLSALRFGDPDAPPRLVFCHANGFNAQSYRAVLEPLDVPALALDLRGHGRTTLPTDPDGLASWHVFADDIVALFDRYVPEPVVLAGHSYGAVSAILAAPRLEGRLTGYVGFDPVLVPALFRFITRSRLGRRYMKMRLPIARKAGQRTSHFEGLNAAFRRYQGRGAFAEVPDAVLRDYLEGGLLDDETGGVRLACDPAWEQAIFCAQAHNLFKAAPSLPDPSRLVFAGRRGRVSTAGQRRALGRLNPAIDVRFETDRDHLFPLQDPAFATRMLAEIMAQAEPAMKSRASEARPAGLGPV